MESISPMTFIFITNHNFTLLPGGNIMPHFNLLYLLLIPFLLTPALGSAQNNEYNTPYSELKILEESSSGIYEDKSYNARTYRKIISTGSIIVSHNIITLDEAANIKVIKQYSGKSLLDKYRNYLSVKKDSYAILSRDNEVAEKYYYTLGSSPSGNGVIEFAFSNGQYYTSQNGMSPFIIKGGYIYDGNMKIKLSNATYGPAQTSFKNIADIGIPIFRYLYKDSKATNKDVACQSEVITIKGKTCYRYTFVSNPTNNQQLMDMYFFNQEGRLIKYGYEYSHIYQTNNNGTPSYRKSNDIALYDIIDLKNSVPNKNIFKLSKDDKFEPDGYFTLDLI